jgi:FtsZ-binding cell division protein ZapB
MQVWNLSIQKGGSAVQPKGARMLADQIWMNEGFQTVAFWVGLGILAWIVRGKDLLRLGRKTEVDMRNTSNREQEVVDQKLSATRRELFENQAQLLTAGNEERARMRERIAVLETTVKAFKEQYDVLLLTHQDLQHKYEAILSENARLQSEKKQLERRLSGALAKKSEDPPQSEEQQ